MWRDRRQSQYCCAMMNIHTSYVEQAATLVHNGAKGNISILTPIPRL